MSISPFFLELRSAYQAEIDDLTFDSEGKDVLQQRLVGKRKELGFLLQMIELNPEMVAVVLHQGFRFRLPAVMEHLLTLDADDLPAWEDLAEAVELAPWAREIAGPILAEPRGDWFLTLAAGLEFMHGKADPAQQARGDDDDQGQDEDDGQGAEGEPGEQDDEDERARDEAGADWLAEQGFDRKD